MPGFCWCCGGNGGSGLRALRATALRVPLCFPFPLCVVFTAHLARSIDDDFDARGTR
jgi:hypothetical protein